MLNLKVYAHNAYYPCRPYMAFKVKLCKAGRPLNVVNYFFSLNLVGMGLKVCKIRAYKLPATVGLHVDVLTVPLHGGK